MNKISVVVAIYRVEKYLEKCLDGIINQTYKNLEIILVDDGSPDKCPEICDRYAKMDDRIRVLHQINQGVVIARGNGAAVATGDYISFIDGDDWLKENMYELMNQIAEKNDADVVVTGYFQGEENDLTKKRNKIDSGVYRGLDLKKIQNRVLLYDTYYEPGIIPALWNKLFRRELLGDIFNRVDPIVRMGEDASISYPVLEKARSIVVDNDAYTYCYRTVVNSMSDSYDDKYFDRAFALINGLKHNLKTISLQNQLKYYSLFILEIGINQLFSKNCKMSLGLRYSYIKCTAERIRDSMDYSNINWKRFCFFDRKLLQSFIGMKYLMLVIMYSGKQVSTVLVSWCQQKNLRK